MSASEAVEVKSVGTLASAPVRLIAPRLGKSNVTSESWQVLAALSQVVAIWAFISTLSMPNAFICAASGEPAGSETVMPLKVNSLLVGNCPS